MEKRANPLLGIGAILAHKSVKNLLGYERIHHGTTSNSAAESIKENGLLKSKAGTSAAKADVDLGRVSKKDIKGKVFTTTNPGYAKHYTNGAFGLPTGKVVSGRVPFRPKSRLKADSVMESISKGTDNQTKNTLLKRVAGKVTNSQTKVYGHSIPSRFIDHGKGGLGNVKQFASKGNIRRYLSTSEGKKRFGKGVAQLGGAAILVAKALKKVK